MKSKKIKILTICGPTGTGKTDLAVNLCKSIDGEIISADSRQVYIGMDITTGKETRIENEFRLIKKISTKDKTLLNLGYRMHKGIKIWLVDAIRPDINFSVSFFKKSF